MDPTTTTPDPIASIEEIPYELAYQAFTFNSMVPDERAAQARAGYVAELTTIHDTLDALARTEAQQRALAEAWLRFKAGFRARFCAVLSARARTASPMVTGGSKFPAERNRKRLDTERRREEELAEWQTRAIKAIRRDIKLAGPAGDPHQDLLDRIAQREERQEYMVEVNALVRKGDADGLRALGLGDATIARVLGPEGQDWRGRQVEFAAYQISNNSAEIRRLRARLIETAQRETAADTFVEQAGAGWRLALADERMCFEFDGKPDETTRAALRGRGWKWAPSRGAWVRQFTQAAVAAARDIVALLPPPTA